MSQISEDDIRRFCNAQLDAEPETIAKVLEDLRQHPEDGVAASYMRSRRQRTLKVLASQGFDLRLPTIAETQQQVSLRQAVAPSPPRQLWDQIRRPIILYPTVAIALGVVCLVLAGWLTGDKDVDRLIVSLQPRPRPTLDSERAIVELDSLGNFRVPAGQRFDMTLNSSIDGYVTFVAVDDNALQILPPAEQPPSMIAAFKETRFGPFPAYNTAVSLIAIVTRDNARTDVAQVVAEYPSTADLDGLVDRLISSLSKEYAPVGVGVIRIQPATGDDIQ